MRTRVDSKALLSPLAGLLLTMAPVAGISAQAVAEKEIPIHTAVEHDPRFESIRDMIIDRVSEDIPSLALGVVLDGEVIWEEAFGWADIEAKIEATPQTIYPIASTAKSLTATGVMALREKGAVSLDEPVAKYLRDADVLTPLAGARDEVTLRRLLSMTAGLPMGWRLMLKPDQPLNRDELLRHHGGLVALPPGKVFHYSNSSLSVPELVIEGATGRSFDEFMETEVFRPLGMTRTGYTSYLDAPRGPVAARYNASGRRITDGLMVLPAGGGGAESTLHDLLRFSLFHLKQPLPDQRSIVSDEALDEMHFSVTELSRNRYAMGWWLSDLGDGDKLLINDGHSSGAVSLVYVLPSRGLAVVALVNTRKEESDFEGQFTDRVAVAVVDALVPGFEARRAAYYERLAEASALTKYRPDMFLGEWRGAARDYTGKIMDVSMRFAEDGEIRLTLGLQATKVVRAPAIRDGLFWGQFDGQIATDELHEPEHVIDLRLLFDGDRAEGYLLSSFGNERGFYGLPSYMRLERKR